MKEYRVLVGYYVTAPDELAARRAVAALIPREREKDTDDPEVWTVTEHDPEG